eukprot:TRINITY_DN1209_c0_g2_i2.p1 TRINITY_DN1209_c0_g2~~TRINITY_DN1209_c0_g2_i2.p1  ORF type:complete len:426 (-),score=48.12 TRINITY_DN1209_c0_g2_i2:184-1419(-)
MELLDFPEELLEEIFVHANVGGLRRFALCCKQFYRLSNEQSLWRRMLQRDLPFVHIPTAVVDARDYYIRYACRRGCLFGFGDSSSGRMGVEEHYNANYPLLIHDTNQCYDIASAGWWHSVFISENRVWLTGEIGDTEVQTQEMTFPSKSRIVKVCSDERFSVFLTEDHCVYGIGDRGGLKDTERIVPFASADKLSVVDIATMGTGVMLVLEDGSAVFATEHGQLLPIQVPQWPSNSITRCFHGQNQCALLSRDHRIVCVGIDSGSVVSFFSPFTELYPPDEPVRQVAIGVSICAVLYEDGRVFHLYGEWNLNDRTDGGIVKGPILEQGEAIAGGNGHIVACTKSGEVYTWGDPYCGELGDGRDDGENTQHPTLVGGLLADVRVTAVSTSFFHNVLLGKPRKEMTKSMNLLK